MRTHGTSALFRWLRSAVPVMSLVCLLYGMLGCVKPEPPAQGPLIRLHLLKGDAKTEVAILTITATDQEGKPKEVTQRFQSAPFDLLGASFPPGTQGAVSVEVKLYGQNDCILASGTARPILTSDDELDVSVTMSAIPLCGEGAVLTVLVASAGTASGTVSSQPSGISCDGLGNGCTLIVKKGSAYTLTPRIGTGTFSGWFGGGCTGTSSCTLTVDQDTIVHATFTSCQGWCKETAPTSGKYPNLMGIGGTAPHNVLAVGDAGTVYRWDGASWKSVTLPGEASTQTLRAVAAKIAGSVTYLAGDQGTLLQLRDGSYSQVPGVPKTNFRAIAIDQQAASTAFIVGDSGTVLTLSDGDSVMSRTLGTANLMAVCQLPSKTPSALLIGGTPSLGGSRAFVAEWDGNQNTTVQMNAGTSITGNLYALHCGTSRHHFASGDNGTFLQRDVTEKSRVEDSWTSVTGVNIGSKKIRSMWSSGDSFIIAVGDSGMILRFDGTSWMPMNSNASTNLYAVWGTSPTNIYAVGDNATVLHYTP